jgi:hypothetical protein
MEPKGALFTFMECTMSEIVHSKAWLVLNDNALVNNRFYGKYNSKVLGTDLSGHVKWSSYRIMEDESEANSFTTHSFIQGDD